MKRKKKKVQAHINPRTLRARLLSGVLILVPLGITLFILSILYSATVGLLIPVVRIFLKETPPYLMPIVALGVLFLLVYVVGTLANFVVGRRLITLGERIVENIPIVKTVYTTSKQVVQMFQNQADTTDMRVALVEFPAPGLRAFGFITGMVTTPDGARCYKVFVPTTPNPTTGFLQVLPESSVTPLDMDGEEAFRVIMSVGYLAPDELRRETAEDHSADGEDDGHGGDGVAADRYPR